MKVILTVKADELKLAQMLSKFGEKYTHLTYKLNRQTKGYLLEVDLDSENLGEFMRRMNHLKDVTYNVEEIRGGGLLDSINVSLLRTNVDALIGKEAFVTKDIDPTDGGVVKIGGELWLAKPVECNNIIKEGSKVRIIRVEGVSLIVDGVDDEKCPC
ncbi:MAG: hypothetical protein FWH37_05120 [Candidatus Bathyarchaeota archaeon]|nr:hypothetical protein [Candidatus Termiticorpusculum sp.]